MAGEEYKVLFEKKLLLGFDEQVVRNDFAKLFKADDERMERLFSGKAYAIRKSVTEQDARRIEKSLARIGAHCRIVSMDGSNTLPPQSYDTQTNHKESDPLFADERPARKPAKRFNFMGRTGRVRFLALSWLVLFVEVASFLLPGYIPVLTGTALTIQETVSIVIATHTLAILLMMHLTITRLHDMGRSGWLWLFILIPLANLLFIFWLSFAPGTKDDNRFGVVPAAPGNLAKAIGVYLPIALVLLLVAAGYLHQEALLALLQTLPEQLLEWSNMQR